MKNQNRIIALGLAGVLLCSNSAEASLWHKLKRAAIAVVKAPVTITNAVVVKPTVAVTNAVVVKPTVTITKETVKTVIGAKDWVQTGTAVKHDAEKAGPAIDSATATSDKFGKLADDLDKDNADLRLQLAQLQNQLATKDKAEMQAQLVELQTRIGDNEAKAKEIRQAIATKATLAEEGFETMEQKIAAETISVGDAVKGLSGWGVIGFFCYLLVKTARSIWKKVARRPALTPSA